MEMRAQILRGVARISLTDAHKAWRRAEADPSESNTRAAFRACVLAARTMRAAAEVSPDDELELLERALLIAERAVTLLRKLSRMGEPATP